MKRLFSRLIACGLASVALTTPAQANPVPHYDHVVVVVMENHRFNQIIGDAQTPYLTQLAHDGALFTNSHGVTHPSQPNYLALFSGNTQGITNDSCPHTFSGDNIAKQMMDAQQSFVGYAEDLPEAGFTGCRAGRYARKHVPWVNFSNVDPKVNQPFSAFPDDFTKLPALAFVVPNMCNDMHDCQPSVGDEWSRLHLDGYAKWATDHNSLLIVTFDEDDYATNTNLVPTILYGAHVKPGQYDEKIDHYNVLASLEMIFSLNGLPKATAITDAWEGSEK